MSNDYLDEFFGFTFFCHFDEFWTMISLSDGFRKVTGYDPSYCLNNKSFSYADLIEKEDKKKVLDHIAVALIQSKSYEVIYRIRTIDDKTVVVLEKGKGIEIDGSIKHIKGVIMKIDNYELIKSNIDTFTLNND